MKKIFTIGLFAISINIQAQIDNITTPADTIKSVAKEVDFFEMSLDELMNIPVSVASKNTTYCKRIACNFNSDYSRRN